MKILIVTVTTSYRDIKGETKRAVENLEINNHIVDWLILTEQLNVDTGDEWKIGPTIWFNLEKARRYALTEKYDYMFILEWDVVPPEHTLLSLIDADADVAVGLYPERPTKVGEKYGGQLLQCCPWSNIPNAEELVLKGEPFEITEGEAGLGCVLIRRSAFEKVKFKWTRAWYYDLYTLNLRVVLDPRVICGHVDRDGRLVEWKP